MCFAFWWFRPLPQTSPSQRPFLRNLRRLQKRSAAVARPPIAKAKATPHAMRFNMGHQMPCASPDFTFWSFRRRPARIAIGMWIPNTVSGFIRADWENLNININESLVVITLEVQNFGMNSTNPITVKNVQQCWCVFFTSLFFLPQLDFEIRHCDEQLSKMIKGAERVASHQGKHFLFETA